MALRPPPPDGRHRPDAWKAYPQVTGLSAQPLAGTQDNRILEMGALLEDAGLGEISGASRPLVKLLRPGARA